MTSGPPSSSRYERGDQRGETSRAAYLEGRGRGQTRATDAETRGRGFGGYEWGRPYYREERPPQWWEDQYGGVEADFERETGGSRGRPSHRGGHVGNSRRRRQNHGWQDEHEEDGGHGGAWSRGEVPQREVRDRHVPEVAREPSADRTRQSGITGNMNQSGSGYRRRVPTHKYDGSVPFEDYLTRVTLLEL